MFIGVATGHDVLIYSLRFIENNRIRSTPTAGNGAVGGSSHTVGTNFRLAANWNTKFHFEKVPLLILGVCF
ncbi:hypothetical protein DPMN_047087 [Dreissena polymorpha]|uniref:Uncharacterized protein n=1 Tax=Dreissena polymorpha TaxID=45954 RepID=A0A9D4I2T6_DREPO|nr:hypothetical protein DPMN_047087 [Dreissena polymorpha]